MQKELRDLGFNGAADRLAVVVSFLERHDFEGVSCLARCPPLASLCGADDLLQSELEFLHNVSSAATKQWLASCSVQHGVVERDSILQQVNNAVDQAGKVAVDNKGVGPQQALKRLKLSFNDQESRSAWVQTAKLNAIFGSAPRSRASFFSGLRCYLNFAHSVLNVQQGRELPPQLDHLLAWSMIFRSADTYSNYLGYVRLACDALALPAVVFDHPTLRRAKEAIRKRSDFESRKRMFIRQDIVREMVVYVLSDPKWVDAAMLFLMCYAFLLRLPSEALPVRFSSGGSLDEGHHSVVQVGADYISLRLRRRKNRVSSSVLKRRCWCKQCSVTCPVHVLGEYLKNFEAGAVVFAGFTASNSLAALRELLALLKVPEANMFRTHDLRRGHARDMQARGASLAEILLAGDWRSAAFLDYLDRVELEQDAVLEAHMCASSSDSD